MKAELNLLLLFAIFAIDINDTGIIIIKYKIMINAMIPCEEPNDARILLISSPKFVLAPIERELITKL